jgi:hypothetical protein
VAATGRVAACDHLGGLDGASGDLGQPVGVSLADPGNALAATTMARHLDIGLLAPLANASAFTGLLLAATTSWVCSGTGGWPRRSRSR